MAYNPNNPNGQATMANSQPVVIASNQASVPVAATLGAETTKVIGVTRTADGSGNLLTSTTNALDVNIKSGNPTTIAVTNAGTFAVQDTVMDAAIIAQEATTSGVKGLTTFGAVTTNAPSYTTAKSDAISLDTSGLLRVSLKDTPANTNKFLVTPDSVALPANQSVNVNQLAGTTTDTNSGNKSAGTLRVVLATDQPQLTNKLLVTPDANSAVNVAQIGGTNVVNGGVAGIQAVGGNVANAVTATANPVPVGGVFTTSPTTLTTGQTATMQFTAAQNIKNDVTTIAGTAADTNSGTKSAGTLRVVLATDQPALTNKILVTPDSVALPANQSINMSQINAHTALEGGTNGSLAVGGGVATNVAITTNPVNTGAQGVSSENSAVTTGRMVQLVADLVGKLIVLPYSNPENFTNGTTAAITDTTTTSVIAAQGAGVRTYITQITVTNSHATVGTFVKITDGASTILHEAYAAAAGGGYTATFPTPLRGTANTAVNAICVTTGANVIASVSGYKGA